jgi:hypothetical protein
MDQPKGEGKGAAPRNPAIVRPPLVPAIPALLGICANKTGDAGIAPEKT